MSPIDASIPRGVQPLQIQNPLEPLSMIAQLQGQREATEVRRLAAEEARSKHQRQRQIEDVMQRAVKVDPATGKVTLDRAVLAAGVSPMLIPEVERQLGLDEESVAKLQTATLNLEKAKLEHLGSAAQTVIAAGGDPTIWGVHLKGAHKMKLIDDDAYERYSAVSDPQQILALAQSFVQRAGGKPPELQKITTVDAQGREVTQFVQPTPGASYPTAPTPADVISVQTVDAQGRPVTKLVPKQVGGEYPNQPSAPSASDLITVQTVDAQGRPVTMVVPKVAGATYPNQPAAGEAGGVKLSPAQQEDLATMLTVEDLGKSALELGDRIKWRGTGPVAGRVGAIGAQFGAGGEDAERLRNVLGNIQGTIAKLRGGTAFSEQEKKMLDSYTPSATDSVLQIKAKLKSLGEFITAKRANTLRVASGQFTPRDQPPATPPPPSGGRGGAPGPNPFAKGR